MSKKIKCFCADDWGMSPSINDGILELIDRELIYSVSLMVTGEYVDYRLNELLLAQAEKQVKLSLHFNLTYMLKHSSPGSLIFSWLLLSLKSEYVLDQFKKQISIAAAKKIRFDLLDGHHHVHLLPFVFKEIDAHAELLPVKQIRLMIDSDHWLSFVQTKLFKFMFKNRIKKWKIVECGYLQADDLASREIFMEKFNGYDLLIIHPAKYNDFHQVVFNDKLKAARVDEYNKILEYVV